MHLRVRCWLSARFRARINHQSFLCASSDATRKRREITKGVCTVRATGLAT
jgi:hypothetical protein